jgi:hypothetical protein
MSKYGTSPSGEPFGYQPVEFLDIPPMHEPAEAPVLDERRLTTSARRRPHGALAAT